MKWILMALLTLGPGYYSAPLTALAETPISHTAKATFVVA